MGKKKLVDEFSENISDGLQKITDTLSKNFIKIRYVDGHRFRLAVIVAAKELISNQDYLNKINVFPVPDGDTGTNMASTLHTIIVSLRNTSHSAIDEMSQNISDSALDGARGNSGVILAQFFYGLNLELENKKHVSTKDFALAAKKAMAQSYTALTEPKEGTILSVIRVWAEIWEKEAKRCDDFVEILNIAIEKTQKELELSTNKLKVLRDSNVVDAGAQGFVNMLEGINAFIKGGKIRGIIEDFKEIVAPFQKDSDIVYDPDVKYRYCTECLVDGENIDREIIRPRLQELGDSLILAGSKTRLKLHIHTNEPEKVFKILEHYGKVRRKKADDMKKQVEHRGQKNKKIAIVMDSSGDLNDDLLNEYNINVVPVRVSFGQKEYIDKVTIDNNEFYAKLLSSKHHPKTSQPSPRDFENMFRYLISHYEEIISIHLASALSGTYQSALSAAKKINPEKIHVFDTRMTSLGLGITALKAAEMVKEQKTVPDILKNLENIVINAKLYIVFGSLEFVIKGGRLNKNIGKILRFFGLLPLIYFDKKGNLSKEGFIKNSDTNWKKVIENSKKQLKGRNVSDIGIIHANAKKKAESAKAGLEKAFPGVKIYIGELGPALGAHAGPGTIGIGMFYKNKES